MRTFLTLLVVVVATLALFAAVTGRPSLAFTVLLAVLFYGRKCES